MQIRGSFPALLHPTLLLHASFSIDKSQHSPSCMRAFGPHTPLHQDGSSLCWRSQQPGLRGYVSTMSSSTHKHGTQDPESPAPQPSMAPHGPQNQAQALHNTPHPDHQLCPPSAPSLAVLSPLGLLVLLWTPAMATTFYWPFVACLPQAALCKQTSWHPNEKDSIGT